MHIRRRSLFFRLLRLPRTFRGNYRAMRAGGSGRWQSIRFAFKFALLTLR